MGARGYLGLLLFIWFPTTSLSLRITYHTHGHHIVESGLPCALSNTVLSPYLDVLRRNVTIWVWLSLDYNWWHCEVTPLSISWYVIVVFFEKEAVASKVDYRRFYVWVLETLVYFSIFLEKNWCCTRHTQTHMTFFRPCAYVIAIEAFPRVHFKTSRT